MKDEKDTQTPTRSHQKSPNYPANSLAEVIEVARKIFASDKRTVLSYESAAKAGGYGSLNGRSRTKLSSLRKYGLLDAVGDGLQISHLAMRILHQPETAPDYALAIKEAALRPEIFRSFYESHRDASEQAIQSELIIKGGFSPEGAKLFAKAFRDTIVFAKLDDSGYIPPNAGDKTGDKSVSDAGNVNTKASIPPVKPPATTVTTATTAIQPGELPVPIGEGRIARVPFPISEEDFDLFVETLKLWKKKLVRKPAVIPAERKFPAKAIWRNNDSDTPVTLVALYGDHDGETYYKSEDGTGIPASQLEFETN
jgi:hypothetical protein